VLVLRGFGPATRAGSSARHSACWQKLPPCCLRDRLGPRRPAASFSRNYAVRESCERGPLLICAPPPLICSPAFGWLSHIARPSGSGHRWHHHRPRSAWRAPPLGPDRDVDRKPSARIRGSFMQRRSRRCRRRCGPGRCSFCRFHAVDTSTYLIAQGACAHTVTDRRRAKNKRAVRRARPKRRLANVDCRGERCQIPNGTGPDSSRCKVERLDDARIRELGLIV
jgi:hypothetical protein